MNWIGSRYTRFGPGQVGIGRTVGSRSDQIIHFALAIPVDVDFQNVWNYCFWVVSHIFDFTFSPWDHYKCESAPIICNASCGICANKLLRLALFREKSTNWTIFMSEVSALVLVFRNLWFLKMKSETFGNDHFPSVSHFFVNSKSFTFILQSTLPEWPIPILNP